MTETSLARCLEMDLGLSMDLEMWMGWYLVTAMKKRLAKGRSLVLDWSWERQKR